MAALKSEVQTKEHYSLTDEERANLPIAEWNEKYNFYGKKGKNEGRLLDFALQNAKFSIDDIITKKVLVIDKEDQNDPNFQKVKAQLNGMFREICRPLFFDYMIKDIGDEGENIYSLVKNVKEGKTKESTTSDNIEDGSPHSVPKEELLYIDLLEKHLDNYLTEIGYIPRLLAPVNGEKDQQLTTQKIINSGKNFGIIGDEIGKTVLLCALAVDVIQAGKIPLIIKESTGYVLAHQFVFEIIQDLLFQLSNRFLEERKITPDDLQEKPCVYLIDNLNIDPHFALTINRLRQPFQREGEQFIYCYSGDPAEDPRRAIDKLEDFTLLKMLPIEEAAIDKKVKKVDKNGFLMAQKAQLLEYMRNPYLLGKIIEYFQECVKYHREFDQIDYHVKMWLNDKKRERRGLK
jgi:hypothetical protein